MRDMGMGEIVRVAVCMSGHMRAVKGGIEAFKQHVIEQSPGCCFDFFVDSWTVGDWRSSTSIENRNAGNLLGDDVLHVMRELQPRVFKLENPIPDEKWHAQRFSDYVKPGYVKKGTAGEHIIAMLYKIRSCDAQLAQYERMHGAAYDLVMRWRTDIAFVSDIALVSEYGILCDQCVFVPSTARDDETWMTDVFAFSNRVNMSRYAMLYDMLDQRVCELKAFRPELLLKHHMNQEQIAVKRLDVDWKVLR